GAFVYVVKPDPSAATNSLAGAGAPPANAGGTDGQQTNLTATVAMQVITVGTTDGNVSAVQGIDPGTMVAADSFNKLTDGAKVIVRPSGSGPAVVASAGADTVSKPS